MTTQVIRWVGCLCVLMFAGCVSEVPGEGEALGEGAVVEGEEPEATVAMPLLIEVPMDDDGHVVSFYEAAPGLILVAEMAPEGKQPVVTEEIAVLPADELLEAIAPDVVQTDAFVEAMTRYHEMALEVPLRPEGGDEVGASRQAVHVSQSPGTGSSASTEFRSRWCGDDSRYERQMCRTGLERYTVGGFITVSGNTWEVSDVFHAYSVVAAATGRAEHEIKTRTWATWSTVEFSVPQGYWSYAFTSTEYAFDFDFKSIAWIPSGGRLHHMGKATTD